MSKLDFLRFYVNAKGLLPTNKKIKNSYHSHTEDFEKLHRYLGMLGFYRKLFPKYFTIIRIYEIIS